MSTNLRKKRASCFESGGDGGRGDGGGVFVWQGAGLGWAAAAADERTVWDQMRACAPHCAQKSVLMSSGRG